jgi:hypothetical protein
VDGNVPNIYDKLGDIGVVVNSPEDEGPGYIHKNGAM